MIYFICVRFKKDEISDIKVYNPNYVLQYYSVLANDPITESIQYNDTKKLTIGKDVSISSSTDYFRGFMGDIRIYNRAFNEEWIQREIINVKSSIMVFDWHQQKLQLVKDLISVAKKNNIKIIGVPHGGHPFTNKLWTNKMFDNNEIFPFGKNWAAFDQVILHDYNHSKFVKLGGFPEKNIKVIGNARLCNEWLQVNDKLNESLKNIQLPKRNNNLLNILYLDHSPKYRSRKKEIIAGLNMVSNLDIAQLFIKPTVSVHNRKFPKKSSIENATSSGLANVNYVMDVPTHLLIDWADVVIGLTTSVLFEAVLKGKHLIIPKYFHDNSTIYEKYDVCWLASNDHELIDIIKSIYKRPNYYPYGDKERENFMTDIIYGGKKERDVLGEYKDFILKEAQLN